MRGWLCCVALGALLVGCASTAAVQGAREEFLAAKDAGAKEEAPFEYYASKAYLELARHASETEDHAQARAWSKQSRQYAAEAIRLAGAKEGVQPLVMATVAACAGPRPLGEREAARIDALQAKYDRAVALEARECAAKELAVASALLDYECYAAALPAEAPRAAFPPAEPALDALLATTDPCWLERHDADADKVADDLDQCPATPGEAQVDEAGCPLDGDGDGVADYQDQCADTPGGVEVELDGCPPDGDSDGVPDYKDGCADTPAAAMVGEDGCSLDGDGDGVADYQDQCADTLQGVAVQADGCPTDGDGDGVADHRDDCPETSSGVAVGEDGCPRDGDGDGVFDERDACPDTLAGSEVDGDGCGPDEQPAATQEAAADEAAVSAGDGNAPGTAAPAADQ